MFRQQSLDLLLWSLWEILHPHQKGAKDEPNQQSRCCKHSKVKKICPVNKVMIHIKNFIHKIEKEAANQKNSYFQINFVAWFLFIFERKNLRGNNGICVLPIMDSSNAKISKGTILSNTISINSKRLSTHTQPQGSIWFVF